MAHVLIVDDEPSICWGLSELVRSMGHSADTAPTAEEAFVVAERRRPDALVLDVRLPGLDGLSAMGRFREQLGPVPTIVITAYGDLPTAIEAMRRGAVEYLVKPFELAAAQHALTRALEPPAAPSGMPSDSMKTVEDSEERQLIGSSAPMQEVFKRIAMVAASDACVHIHGESGTGKELVARAIHQYSRRARGPFVAVNLAALSPTLAESELFGHVRGAFTGAETNRKGVLEQAHGGTIFLDEAADIPLSVQVKLLRVLEYGQFVPVGGDRPVQSDFRIITATHQDLGRLAAEGRFRADLYYRLMTFTIELPPLRDRSGDIRLLAEYFLDRLAAKNRCARPILTADALGLLESRPWYGNVRELRNALEHALLLARGGPLCEEHFPPPTPAPHDAGATREAAIAAMITAWAEQQFAANADAGDLYERLMRLVEPPLFRAVLRRNRGQFSAAAKQLGLHRVTLRRKMAHYDGETVDE